MNKNYTKNNLGRLTAENPLPREFPNQNKGNNLCIATQEQGPSPYSIIIQYFTNNQVLDIWLI